MYSISEKDDMVECPYDKTHRMLRKRLQSHLIKCKENHPEVELQTCPYNKIHLISELEYVNHLNECPDRTLLNSDNCGGATVETNNETVVRHEPVKCEENWDDTEVEDYNPLKRADKNALKLRPMYCYISDPPQVDTDENEASGNNDDNDGNDDFKEHHVPMRVRYVNDQKLLLPKEMSDSESEEERSKRKSRSKTPESKSRKINTFSPDSPPPLSATVVSDRYEEYRNRRYFPDFTPSRFKIKRRKYSPTPSPTPFRNASDFVKGRVRAPDSPYLLEDSSYNTRAGNLADTYKDRAPYRSPAKNNSTYVKKEVDSKEYCLDEDPYYNGGHNEATSSSPGSEMAYFNRSAKRNNSRYSSDYEMSLKLPSTSFFRK